MRNATTARSSPAKSATSAPGLGVPGQRQRGHAQARRPALGARDQLLEVGLDQVHVVAREELGGLWRGEGEVGAAQLGQLAGDAQPVQRQVGIGPRAEHEAQRGRRAPDELGEQVGERGAVGVLDVVEDEDERRVVAGRSRTALGYGGEALGDPRHRGRRGAAQRARAKALGQARPEAGQRAGLAVQRDPRRRGRPGLQAGVEPRREEHGLARAGRRGDEGDRPLHGVVHALVEALADDGGGRHAREPSCGASGPRRRAAPRAGGLAPRGVGAGP